MPSESGVSGSPLADRLRQAASVHVSAVLDAETPEQVEDLIGKATAAVLRETADELFEALLSRVEPGMVVRPNVIPDLLRKWAVSVEEGER
jgi:hypothetical protein